MNRKSDCDSFRAPGYTRTLAPAACRRPSRYASAGIGAPRHRRPIVISGKVHPPLAAALREIADRVPAERIDTLWLFPPRRIGNSDSAVAVLSLFDEQDPGGRREVLTLLSSGSIGEKASRHESTLTDHGSVPVERVERLILGVVHRLKDERETPRVVAVDGDAARWAAFLADSSRPG